MSPLYVAFKSFMCFDAGYQVAKDAFGGALSSQNLCIGPKRCRLKRGDGSGIAQLFIGSLYNPLYIYVMLMDAW